MVFIPLLQCATHADLGVQREDGEIRPYQGSQAPGVGGNDGFPGRRRRAGAQGT